MGLLSLYGTPYLPSGPSFEREFRLTLDCTTDFRIPLKPKEQSGV